MVRTDLSDCVSLRPAPQSLCLSAGANRPVPVTFADWAEVPGILGVIGPSARFPEKPAELWTCSAGLRRRRPWCGGPRGLPALGRGSQLQGQDCSLRVPSACSPRLCTLRVPLAGGSCSAQWPLKPGRLAHRPCLPQAHLARDFFSRRLPRQCFYVPLDAWSFICSTYIIWDLNYYAPEILSERDRGFHGFWRGDSYQRMGRAAQGPPGSPTGAPIALSPLGVGEGSHLPTCRRGAL